MRWSHDFAGLLRKMCAVANSRTGWKSVVYELNDLIFWFVVAAAAVGAILLAIGLYHHCRRNPRDRR
jgi:hypothetical protein